MYAILPFPHHHDHKTSKSFFHPRLEHLEMRARNLISPTRPAAVFQPALYPPSVSVTSQPTGSSKFVATRAEAAVSRRPSRRPPLPISNVSATDPTLVPAMDSSPGRS